MTTDFNQLFWHDANLLSVYIDRKNPGENDVVSILVAWPESNSPSCIEFYDCYSFKSEMNFGIVANESILSGECLIDSDELDSIRKEWKKMNVNLENLKCFKITTNSTGSWLKIFAMNFRIK